MGFNYVTTTAINSTEMWQKESYDAKSIDDELALASGIGYNSCRVFLQFLVWEAERDGFLNTFDNFLSLAHKHGISVVPILFDNCAFSGNEPILGKQQEPAPGIHNSGWTPSPGFTIMDDPSYDEKLEEYVKTVITRFATDNRILVWDLYNEPGNTNHGIKSLPLVRKTFSWARECAPMQPLTMGVWEYLEDWEMELADLSDIISFHDYGSIETTRERVEHFAGYKRPMFCTEWLHRQSDNNFKSHLPYYKSKNISAYNWGLIQGKTQTHLSWNKEENSYNGLPKIWQHDIYHENLEPYDPEEISLIKQITIIG
jgi:hypothetical protein